MPRSPPVQHPRAPRSDHWWPLVASALNVNHVLPLALGGTDTDGNVQPFCRPCHRLKTREDFGALPRSHTAPCWAEGVPMADGPRTVRVRSPRLAARPPGGPSSGDGSRQRDEPCRDALNSQAHPAAPEFEKRVRLVLGHGEALQRKWVGSFLILQNLM
ncbi:HNH endonuclease [Streptomyces melanogenes]|uniref:HNH endonuclease n=1 Tax=Streptomyces melanogenes TaxID=67326 RepID=UPI0037B9858A